METGLVRRQEASNEIYGRYISFLLERVFTLSNTSISMFHRYIDDIFSASNQSLDTINQSNVR